MRSRLAALVFLVLAGCTSTVAVGTSGATGTGGAGGTTTATDAGSDAPAYLACMDSMGQLDDSLKTCQSDADCVLLLEQLDCCGTILFVGVAQTAAAMFATCESAWVASFPGCGCATNQNRTEDGKTGFDMEDAGGPGVHCAGGLCLSYR
jgi:hypothetical protein